MYTVYRAVDKSGPLGSGVKSSLKVGLRKGIKPSEGETINCASLPCLIFHGTFVLYYPLKEKLNILIDF